MGEIPTVNWSEKVSETLFTGLGDIRESDCFSDVTIEVEGHKFQCHKLLLSSMSGYFKSMFTSGFQEATNGTEVIQLHEVKQSIFQVLLDIIYTGKDLITKDNAENLLHAAIYFQMDFLSGKCQEILLANITPSNCLRLMNLARQCNCKELETKAKKCFYSNFTEVINMPEFLDLIAEDLRNCILKSTLAVDEEVVCDAVFKWFLHDLENRKNGSDPLLEVLRLPRTSSTYLLQLSNKYPSLKDNLPKWGQYVEAAVKYHLLPAMRKEYNTLQTDHRRNSNLESVQVLINCKALVKEASGFARLRNWSHKILAFNIHTRDFKFLSDMPLAVNEGFSCCIYGEDVLYVMGGQNSDGKCFKYNGILNTWTACSSMPESRFDHSACTIGKHVYIFGGCCTADQIVPCSSVGKYDVHAEEWEMSSHGSICQVVRKPMMAAMDDKLYAFGGKKIGQSADDQHLNVVQCYDPKTATCTIIDVGSPEMGTYQSVLNFEGHTYIVTLKENKNFLFMFDGEKCWKHSELVGQARHGFGVYQRQGRLWLVGGYRDPGNKRHFCKSQQHVKLNEDGIDLKRPDKERAIKPLCPYDFQMEPLTIKKAYYNTLSLNLHTY